MPQPTRDVILNNEKFAAYGPHTRALAMLDQITQGNVRERRKIAQILSKTLEVIQDFARMEGKNRAFQAFLRWWEGRGANTNLFSDPRINTLIDNHITATAREKILRG